MAGVWTNILNGFGDIFSAPLKDLSIFWLLAPIILFWLILEIYFGRYKTEKLGWNTTLGYGLNMFWIVIISLRTLFANNFELFTVEKLFFLIFITMYSFFIIFISFTHTMKESIFFLFASPSIIYYFSAIAVLWFNDLFVVSLWTTIDLIILYIIILILEAVMKKLIPSAQEGIMPDTGISNGMNSGINNARMNNFRGGMRRF